VSDRFDDLVGEIDDPRERERLRRVHALLLSVDPPPEVSPAAALIPDAPARRRARPLALLAAALAVAAFGAGYLVGGRDAPPDRVIEMAGIGAERDATASIEVLAQDEAGNWPMRVLVRGLEPSRDRSDFYELWLTANGRKIASCGRFVVAEGLTTVTLSVPYGLRRYDGWVVTRAGSDDVLLTTA
jgi:hypothetical protein